MSPILVRPVREQFEHDRVIRLLQVRYRRKFEVAINPGSEQNASVASGDLTMYPDVVLFSQDRGRKLQGTIEVETGESVNTLEAMAEWGPFSRLRAPFVLYIPPNSLDTARRLCTEHHVAVSEIWTYHTAPDQIRFTMVQRAPESEKPAPRAKEAKPAKRKIAAVRKPAAKKAAPAKATPTRRVRASGPASGAPASGARARAAKSSKSAKPARTAKATKKPSRRR